MVYIKCWVIRAMAVMDGGGGGAVGEGCVGFGNTTLGASFNRNRSELLTAWGPCYLKTD